MRLIIFIIIFTFLNSSVFAYFGPGMVGGVIIATFGIIIATCAAIIGIAWFPIKRYLKNKKSKKKSNIQ